MKTRTNQENHEQNGKTRENQKKQEKPGKQKNPEQKQEKTIKIRKNRKNKGKPGKARNDEEKTRNNQEQNSKTRKNQETGTRTEPANKHKQKHRGAIFLQISCVLLWCSSVLLIVGGADDAKIELHRVKN